MESFIPPSGVAELKGVVLDAWATGVAIQEGGTELVFAYYHPETQERTYTAPQTVTISWPKGSPQVLQDASGEEASVDVILRAPAPFDCQRGYTFGFGPEGAEQRGEVLVVYPPRLGMVRAVATLSAR